MQHLWSCSAVGAVPSGHGRCAANVREVGERVKGGEPFREQAVLSIAACDDCQTVGSVVVGVVVGGGGSKAADETDRRENCKSGEVAIEMHDEGCVCGVLSLGATFYLCLSPNRG